jgi:hypothetical protein
MLALWSFVLPLLAWCLVSYVPAVWHPLILVTNPGDVAYLETGMRMDRQAFADAVTEAREAKTAPPQGIPANPVYLPAPAFGALMVAILGIYDGPKIAIIVIGTFFQQVLIIANTTRQADTLLIEAALTLGARKLQHDGWAWTDVARYRLADAGASSRASRGRFTVARDHRYDTRHSLVANSL